MKKTIGLALLIFGLAACGGSSDATTSAPSAPAAAAPTTSATAAPTTVAPTEGALAGLAFEVHQEPG